MGTVLGTGGGSPGSTQGLVEAVGFRNSAAGLRRLSCSGLVSTGLVSRGTRGSAAGGEVLVNEFDGLGVVAAVAAERATESVVELVDVGGVESAVVGDVPLEFERHLLHEPERASARGLRDPNVMAVKLRERVGYVQRRATSRRCHPSNVSGRTEKLVHAARGNNRLNAARNARSAR